MEQLELAACLTFSDRSWRGVNPDGPIPGDPLVFSKALDHINGLAATLELVEAGSVASLEPLGFCTLRREGSATFVDLRAARFLPG